MELIPSLLAKAQQTGVGVWFVPQAFNWRIYRTKEKKEYQKYRFPTEQEIRSMALAGAVSGAKGFLFYNYSDIFDEGEKWEPGSAAEIWVEADLGLQTWSGTRKEFEQFFSVVLKRLKTEFPELKIGGPAFCVFNENQLATLLDECKSRGVTPDFISWHNYTANANPLIAQPARIRQLLDDRGLKATELCINEWHYLLTGEGVHTMVSEAGFKHAACGATGFHGIDSAAFNLAVLAGWHDTPLDSAFYYGVSETGNWGFRTPLMGWSKNYYSMKMFGCLVTDYALRVKTKSQCGTVYLLGALSEDRKNGCLLVSDYRGDRNALAIAVNGMEDATVSAVLLDDANDLVPVPVERVDQTLVLHKNGTGSAAFLMFFRS